MNREALLKKLTVLDFMAVDLCLYLDTHPGDKEALRKYDCIIEEANKVRNVYENSFGPLCSYRSVNKGSWQWIDDPWPWNTEFNYDLRGEK